MTSQVGGHTATTDTNQPRLRSELSVRGSGRGLRRSGGLAVSLALSLTLAGCFTSSSGDAPLDKQFYYPVGLALTPSGKTLFVVNSDFDLRYNAGTVLALDAEKIRQAAKLCASTGGKGNTCIGVDPDTANLTLGSVRLGAFASDIVVAPLYDSGGQQLPTTKGRILLPVRGDATLTFVDFEERDGGVVLGCYTGAKLNEYGRACDARNRAGNDPGLSSRDLALEGEPFAVAIPSVWPEAGIEPRRSGGIATIIHQQSGNVSVFVNALTAGAIPRLAYNVGGMPTGASGIVALDLLDAGGAFTPRFLVTNRSQNGVFALTYYGDVSVDRASLGVTDAIPIPTNSSGIDTRGIVMDPPNEGESRPTRVFLTSRSPASLVIGQVDPTSRRVHFYDNVPLPIGPARLARTVISTTDAGGKTVLRSRIYATAYDARTLTGYDPQTRQFTTITRTGRGPYTLTFDPVHMVGYVVNFTDMTVQVMDMDPQSATFERIVYTVGIPADRRVF